MFELERLYVGEEEREPELDRDDLRLLLELDEDPELCGLFTDDLFDELLDLYVGDELLDALFETFDRDDLTEELGFVDPEAFEFVFDALLLLVYVLLFAAVDLVERVEFTVPVLRDDLVEFMLLFEGNLELRVDADEADDLDETEFLNDALADASFELLVFDAYLELATVDLRLLRL